MQTAFTIAEIGQTVAWIMAGIGVLVAGVGFFATRKDKSASDAAKIERICVSAENTEKAVSRVETRLEQSDKKMDGYMERLVAVELKTDSAHRRLDAAGIGKAE